MTQRVIGLDIGTHAVRAAEVQLGTPPELRAFGQVGLPRGAVEHGEVIDPGAVASAIRRLWHEARLRSRSVRVGVAGLRTIVRQVEMPAMAEAELRSAIELQAADFIPLPVEDAVLDFQVLEPFVSSEGEPMVRVLIAAVHRDMLQNVLTAVREAGLQTMAVDLVPFALVRSLAGAAGAGAPPPPPPTPLPSAPLPPQAPTAEAIVSVGAGVSVVVVHEDGVPRFVRIVAMGGDDLTRAVEDGLGLPYDQAEILKRQLQAGVARADEARQALQRSLGDLLNEIQGSLDFYAQQPDVQPYSRVLVTGGGALLEGFVERLADGVTAPVAMAEPRSVLRVADVGFAPEELPLLDPYLPVPVGLALGAGREGARINLLPSRERRVVETRRVMVGSVAVLLALVGVLALVSRGRADQLRRVKDQVAQQQQRNGALQAQITGLNGAQDLQSQVDTGRTLLAQALATDVSWSRILQEIARVIPGDVWLNSFSGTLVAQQGTGAGAGQAGQTGLIQGSATFSAVGVDFPSTAAWLQRLASVPSFTGAWVNQATKGDVTVGAGKIRGVTFSATATLTDSARSERSRLAREQSPSAGTATPPPGTAPTTAPTTAPPSRAPSSTAPGAGR